MALGGLAPFPRRLGGGKPSAAKWLHAIKSTLGSAFTTDDHSIVGAENIATARLFAGLSSTSERVVKNSIPTTAYDALRSWADRLGISIRDDESADDIRSACMAKYKAMHGPTASIISESLKDLLGSDFVSLIFFNGQDLDNPPDSTYWEGINPLPYNLGGNIFFDDEWTSTRCNVLVVIKRPDDIMSYDFNYLVNVQMYELLDRLLPAYATWSWTVAPYDGFDLDNDELDFNSF
jgi:hypothetical protein